MSAGNMKQEEDPSPVIVKTENCTINQPPQYSQFQAFNNYIQSYIASFHLSQQIKQLKHKHQELIDRVLHIEVLYSAQRTTSIGPNTSKKRRRVPSPRESADWLKKSAAATSALSLAA